MEAVRDTSSGGGFPSNDNQALISVSDKAGLVPFVSFAWRLVTTCATSGSEKVLAAGGLACRSVA